jgi:Zn-dependent peptidase ImmA (M78 family)/DNA-binding XRE family transcriptional regulator
MVSSFGQRLKAARVMAGLSMDALVAKMGQRVSKQAISKYENNLMSPDSSILIAMSDALGVKPDYFFSQYEIAIDSINFRKRAALGKKVVESLKSRIRDTIERYSELESFFIASQPFANPLSSFVIANLDDIQQGAMKLRKAWSLGSEGPISYVIDLLEEHSVRVLEIDGGDGFDGLSGWVNSSPFLILNSVIPADRKRLTALHEFAHISLQFAESLSDSEKEKLCHSFGGAFLLPRDVLIKELGPKRLEVSFFELDRLKKQYGISMQAIMYRARQEGIISEYIHEAFSREISSKKWRKQEPNHYPIGEHPHHFEQLLHRAISEELISVSKAAYLANTSIEDIRRQRML